MPGTRIVPWQGNTENRSGWNPASIDGVITPDGKYIDFPEGVTWKQYKQTADDDAALMAKLKKLMELVDKYIALKAKRGQGARPAGPTTRDMGDGSRLTTDAKGNVAATDTDGDAYIPGSNPNLPQNKVKESINFKGSIAQSLVESFGYQLDELFSDSAEDRIRARAAKIAGEKPLSSYGSAGQNVQAGRAGYTPPTTPTPVAPSSVAPTTSSVAKTAVTPAATTGAKAAGAGSKLLGRALPGVGAVLGAQGAYDSYKKGDYLGAALNGLSGAFSLVPGLGWIPAVGLGAWQAGRELSGATDKYDNPTDSGQGSKDRKAGGALSDLQRLQQIIGAKPDGVMGPETKQKLQAWQQKQGITADGIPGPETYKKAGMKESAQMKSLAETMRDLQQRLTMLEEPSQEIPPVVEPTPEELATAETAKQLGAEIGKVGNEVVIIAKDKTIIDPETKEILVNNGRQLAGTGKTYEPAMAEGYDELEESLWGNLFKGAARLGRTGAVVGKRAARVSPGKAALGVGAAGLAGGYTAGKLGNNDPVKPNTPVKPPVPGGGGGNPNPPATPDTPAVPDTSADDAELAALKAQIDALIKELSTSKNPEIQKGLADVQKKLG
jgi:peptidoglycan hydrolase-like protein with peptidoglycan-binding domain